MRQLTRGWAPAGIAIAVVAIILVWGALQPWTSNRFGYALPGKSGLPAYVYAQGRRYHSTQVCANDPTNPCEQGVLQCLTEANLRSQGEWPLISVGTMFTLFGAPHPLLRNARNAAVNAPYIVATGADCYVEYSLEGSP